MKPNLSSARGDGAWCEYAHAGHVSGSAGPLVAVHRCRIEDMQRSHGNVWLTTLKMRLCIKVHRLGGSSRRPFLRMRRPRPFPVEVHGGLRIFLVPVQVFRGLHRPPFIGDVRLSARSCSALWCIFTTIALITAALFLVNSTTRAGVNFTGEHGPSRRRAGDRVPGGFFRGSTAGLEVFLGGLLHTGAVDAAWSGSSNHATAGGNVDLYLPDVSRVLAGNAAQVLPLIRLHNVERAFRR